MTEPANTRLTPQRLLSTALILFLAYQLPEALQIYPLMLLVLPLAWACSRVLGFRGLRAWYIDARPGWALLLAAGLALACACKLAALLAGEKFGVYSVRWTGITAATPFLLMFAWQAFQTFIPSISEDILTRGLVRRAFPGIGATWLYVPLAAAIFVLNHIYRLHKGPVEWLMLFVFGLAYAAALYRTGSLWAAVGVHWGWNFTNAVVDQLADVSVSQAGTAPFLSMIAHVLMLAGVLFLWRGRPSGEQECPR
ncbi:CPBP family intramembrane glutamic endopeptidase [Massilia sp. SM-13]|uniref:CPBP family intramembrane glutamic endopeptidase n=1 Tax=Pseudoduganella rhizocola TaxID=3382643 RepID=UPI0038B456F4